jgi:hypothetical protein
VPTIVQTPKGPVAKPILEVRDYKDGFGVFAVDSFTPLFPGYFGVSSQRCEAFVDGYNAAASYFSQHSGSEQGIGLSWS